MQLTCSLRVAGERMDGVRDDIYGSNSAPQDPVKTIKALVQRFELIRRSMTRQRNCGTNKMIILANRNCSRIGCESDTQSPLFIARILERGESR